VHYIVQMEYVTPADGSGSSGSGLLTFELQLKTFPSMIASDLYHNVIYKSLLPQTSACMADTIKRCPSLKFHSLPVRIKWREQVRVGERIQGADVVLPAARCQPP
jgi:hypothetical protein